MVKIFIGNLPDGGLVGNDDVRPLFEAFGTVTECEVIKNYGWALSNEHLSKNKKKSFALQLNAPVLLRFVHMDSESASQEAIRNLNGKHDFHGRKMKVRIYCWLTLELKVIQIHALKVELSDNKGQSRRNTQKLFVGNIADGTTDEELRWLNQIHCILHKNITEITVF